MSSGAGGNQKGGGGSAAPGNPKRARKRAPTRAAKRVPQAPAPVHPEFEVDLDAPADTRWAHVIDAFKYQLAAIVPAVEESLVGEWLAAQDTRSARLAHKGIAAVTHLTTMRLPYRDEVRAVAQALGLPMYKALLLQLAYELSAACTSFVKDSPAGPILGRTLDWPLPFLADVIVNVTFMRGGKPLFRATTFPGYVGCLTASKPGAFAVSVNFRTTCTGGWGTIVAAIGRSVVAAVGSGCPVSFLVRKTMEEAPDFPAAVAMLSRTRLIAPTYLTVAGVRPGEGVCITRDRSGPVPGRNQWLQHGDVVQCNMDHWDRDPATDELMGESLLRRHLGRHLLSRIAHDDVSFDSLRPVLEAYPVGCEMTAHYTMACPASGAYDSGQCVWLNDDMEPPAHCCHLRVTEVPATQAAPGASRLRFQRACRKQPARSGAASASRAHGYESYYCAKHDPFADAAGETGPAADGATGAGAGGGASAAGRGHRAPRSGAMHGGLARRRKAPSAAADSTPGTPAADTGDSIASRTKRRRTGRRRGQETATGVGGVDGSAEAAAG